MDTEQKDSNEPYSPEGGPKFDIDDDWDEESKGWISRYGSSVILPIIAFAILAGGIYLYANQKQEDNLIVLEEDEDVVVKEDLELNEDLVFEEEESIIVEEEPEPVIEEIIPETRKEGKNIIEKAIKGEGVTHLARRALKNYLVENSENLTNEHKVFVEDFLKDRNNSQSLEVNEEVSFSEGLIQEAIDESKKLSPDQLNNLKQYSILVNW